MKKFPALFALLLVSYFLSAQEAPEGLFINSKAPNFKAKDQHGNEVELKSLVKKGKVILIFYRGQWSQYCNIYLRKLQDSIQSLKDKNATLIAVTPELPENIAKTVEKTSAQFPILYDEDLKIMKAYDVEYEVQEDVLTRYRNSGIKVDENNGRKNGNFLPITAAYIIDKESNITYRFFHQDYKKRPSVQELVKNL
jgi:peroxiredoxin